MTPVPLTGDLDMSQTRFWTRPPAWRHAAYARLRALPSPPYFAAPDLPGGVEDTRGYYALVRHADVTEASRNPQVFSSAAGATSIPDRPAEFNEYFGSMISMDDPRHARLRRIVSRAFTPRMVAKFTDDVQRTAAAIVDELLAAGPGDFVQQVSARLPLKITCEMMGIGSEHYDMVLRNTSIILSGADPEILGGDREKAIARLLAAGADLTALVADLAERRRADPADDLISALASANVDGERLTATELASFFILLVAAGTETTRSATSHALVLFTAYPDQRAALLEDIDARIGPAVEEIIRCASPVIWMRRTLTRDFSLNGTPLAEGDKVLMMYQSANRDESVFADPDRFDIARSPNPHLGFGGAGPHFCLGAHLARREITAILRELLTRIPDIRAAGEPGYLLPGYLMSHFIDGIKRLPCDFT